MHLASTKIKHGPDGWKIDFIGDDGDAVAVKAAGGADLNEKSALVVSWCV